MIYRLPDINDKEILMAYVESLKQLETKLDEVLDMLSSEDTECGIILRAKGPKN